MLGNSGCCILSVILVGYIERVVTVSAIGEGCYVLCLVRCFTCNCFPCALACKINSGDRAVCACDLEYNVFCTEVTLCDNNCCCAVSIVDICILCIRCVVIVRDINCGYCLINTEYKCLVGSVCNCLRNVTCAVCNLNVYLDIVAVIVYNDRLLYLGNKVILSLNNCPACIVKIKCIVNIYNARLIISRVMLAFN